MRHAALVLALAGSCAAFGLDPGRFSLYDGGTPLLTPDFSSSASFTFTSGGGRSWGTGTYIGTMGLALHPRVTAVVDVGYSRLIDFRGPDAGLYLGGVGLEWRPSDMLNLQLHVTGAFAGESPVSD